MRGMITSVSWHCVCVCVCVCLCVCLCVCVFVALSCSVFVPTNVTDDTTMAVHR